MNEKSSNVGLYNFYFQKKFKIKNFSLTKNGRCINDSLYLPYCGSFGCI